MIKALYLSNSLAEIKSANYQYEIFVELKNHYHIDLIEINKIYPDELLNILKYKVQKCDFIIVGHSYLGDKNGKIGMSYRINLFDLKKPVIFFLNKEYVNLKHKLEWININKPILVITHSLKFYKNSVTFIKDFEMYYLPFAADHKLFTYNKKINKDIDLSFSGILKNTNVDSDQSDTRLSIMNEIFYSIGDIAIIKKKSFCNLKIYWNSVPRNKYFYALSRIIGKYQFLDINEYALIQKRSKSFLNTISPFGIISPRYYENFLSKSLIFSEESSYLKESSINNLVITFKNTEEFKEKFFYYLDNKNKRDEIIEKSFKEGYKLHTWKVRINTLRNIIFKFI